MEGGGVKMNNLAATKGQKGIGGQCHPYIYIQIILNVFTDFLYYNN